jgi:hypothetical protein
MGQRGRRRQRRRPLRWLAAVAVTGAVVMGLPQVDGSLVSKAMEYGPDWRLNNEDPSASRSDERPGFDEGFLDDTAEGVPDEEAKAQLGQSARVELTPRSGAGRLAVVPAGGAVPVRGQLIRYVVKVEEGLPYNSREFAETIKRVLNDKRSWGRGGQITFQQVNGGAADFTIALSSPALTDKVCGQSGLDTDGRVSCFARKSNTAMLNGTRWATGVAAYGKDVASYRVYLINHEVGHRLGHRHVKCPGAGQPAPVMVQQTKGVGACKPNPWPHP